MIIQRKNPSNLGHAFRGKRGGGYSLFVFFVTIGLFNVTQRCSRGTFLPFPLFFRDPLNEFGSG